MNPTVLVCAADASGDLHAAELLGELRRRVPGLRAFGVGGRALAEAGLRVEVPQRELAVGGLVEVVTAIPRVVRAWRRIARALRRERPALAILVDSPDFNIPLARRIRRAGVPVLYYISPQVWAWRRGRTRKLARRVDRMAVIFPFEPACYEGTGLRVEFVGHPLVERMRKIREGTDRDHARATLGLPGNDPLVVMLPGSRHTELGRGLALQLGAARALHARRPEIGYVLALAPTLGRGDVEASLRAGGLPSTLRLHIVEGRAHEAILAADVALAKPGTVTLEIALLGRPLVVAGRAHPLSAALAKRLVRLPSAAMPNLIAGAPVVPEFLQEEAVPDRIARAIETLLEGPARELQLERLAQVAARLGPGGAARRTAAIAEEMMGVAAAAA